MLTPEKLVERASTGARESKTLDFKSEFDVTARKDWCEIIKDIVAFANTDGGVIIFGVNDNGTISESDVSQMLSYDTADITNKIERYTGYQFSDFEIVPIKRGADQCVAMVIYPSEVPIIFVKPGTYAVDDGKQKTAFAQGTLYFRHGSKSEPGNRDDLLKWRDREIARIRKDWLGGIRKIVDAPAGYSVNMAPHNRINDPYRTPVIAKISSKPGAMLVSPQNAEDLWPYRQSELISRVNDTLGSAANINSHDIYCIKFQHNISPSENSDWMFKPHPNASPQYSKAFVQFLVNGFLNDSNFFLDARRLYKKKRY